MQALPRLFHELKSMMLPEGRINVPNEAFVARLSEEPAVKTPGLVCPANRPAPESRSIEAGCVREGRFTRKPDLGDGLPMGITEGVEGG